MREQLRVIRPLLRKLWIPTLLGIIAATSLFIQLASPINCSDLWWHMLHGRLILESGSLIIDHSSFTWTPAVHYFPYTGWLGQITLYLIYEFTGSAGLMALRYGVFFLIFFLGWRYALTRGIAAHPLTWTIILLGLALTWQGPLIKTELFSTGFFSIAVWLYFHMRHKGDRSWRLPYVLPLLLVIWVNVHGAFIIAALFFVAAAIGEILNSKFSPNQAMSPKLQKHFFIAFTLCFPALLITPFGYDLPYTIIIEILSQKGFHARILGYVPTFLFNIPPYYLLDYMIIAMTLFVFLIWQKLKNRQTDWVVILTFLGYCGIYTQLVRVTVFLGPVFLFICLDLLAEKRESWAWPRTKTAKTLLTTLCVLLTLLIGGRILIYNSCVLSNYKDIFTQAFGISHSFPIEETKYIEKNIPGKKIGNIYRDGGYLEYHLWPKKLALIDTRYFPFRAWVDDYFSFAEGVDIEKFVTNHPADFWLINYKFINPLNWFSQSKEWEPIFLGPVGVIFMPAASAPDTPAIVSDIGSKMAMSDYVYAFNAANSLQNIAFAKRIYQAAKDIRSPYCNEFIVLAHEMKDNIDGRQAYMNSNYTKAFKLLGKKTKYIASQDNAANALMKLAEQSLNQGDINGARDWYLKVFKTLPKVTIADVYNLAVLDWLYHNSDNVKQPDNIGGLEWQKLADLILTQKDVLKQSQHYIIETAKAMKAGHYDGTAPLIPRDGNLSHVTPVKNEAELRTKQ